MQETPLEEQAFGVGISMVTLTNLLLRAHIHSYRSELWYPAFTPEASYHSGVVSNVNPSLYKQAGEKDVTSFSAVPADTVNNFLCPSK